MTLRKKCLEEEVGKIFIIIIMMEELKERR